MALTDNYACEDCGAMNYRPAFDLCDTCLLKFYFDNPNASSFADWREPDYSVTHNSSKPNLADLLSEQFDWFSKGYDGGVDDVLTALAEFCHQGGSLNTENVVAWADTYKTESGEQGDIRCATCLSPNEPCDCNQLD